MLKRMMLIVLILSFGKTFATVGQDDVEDLPFFMTFVPNIQFAPVYVAQAKGYDADAGYNFVVEYGDENVGVDLIAAGEIPFGVISGEQVILARGGGRPVVYVYEWFQEYPVAIVVPDTTEGVETVADLEGLKVGIPGRFGATYSGLTALLGANDMTESDIQLEPIGFAAPDVVCAGGVMASVVYVNNEPLQIQQRADAGECGEISGISVLPVADAVDMVANGLVTSEDNINDNPAMVKGVTQAFHNGLKDVINNPAEAYLISLDYVENLPISDEFEAALEAAAEAQNDFLAEEPDHQAIVDSRVDLLTALEAEFDDEMLIQFRVLLATIDLWDAEVIGMTNPESWETTQNILDTMGMLAAPIELEDAYTNDFVPTE